MLLTPYWQQKGVLVLEILTIFCISVAANVVSYYICKWLDRAMS